MALQLAEASAPLVANSSQPSDGVCRTAEAAVKSVAELRNVFDSRRTIPYEFRRKQLLGLQRFLIEKEEALSEALRKDLGRSRLESISGELTGLGLSIDYTLQNLKTWMKPGGGWGPIELGVHTEVRYEPKGVILVLSPWNFPIMLTIDGMIAAFASGNCVFIKPSEASAACTQVMCEFLPRYVEPGTLACADGDGMFTQAVLDSCKFDHIVYTGSPTIAKFVTGNKNVIDTLTPVTLELGGKAPAIVGKSCMQGGCFTRPEVALKSLLRKLFKGKLQNTGQVCVSIDYVNVHKDIGVDRFVELWREYVVEGFGEDPCKSEDWGRLINQRSWRRLKNMLETTKGNVIQVGSEDNEDSRLLRPTLVVEPPEGDAMFQQEIFGPILIVLSWDGNKEKLMERINSIDKNPLACYVFSHDATEKAFFSDHVRAGNMMINDTITVGANVMAPFGGIGNSGNGAQHGHHGFLELSYQKPVCDGSRGPDLDLFYPPYSRNSAMIHRLKNLWTWRGYFFTLQVILLILFLGCNALGVWLIVG
jgi:aldehyde dehydrogenase (NAD+)